MRRLSMSMLGLALLACRAGAGDWESIVPGIEYRHTVREGVDAHAVRVDLDAACVVVVATAAADRGVTVSEFARRKGAVVAINGDYFDPALAPVGLAMGDGELWAQADERVRRQEVVGVGGRRVEVAGPTLPELAALMVEVGACTALNLDGGGSSALWVRDRVVNQPSDLVERPVANHLAVVPAADCDSQ